MDHGMTIRAPLSSKLALAAIVIGIWSIPILWVFSNPTNEETPVAFAIALAAPIVAFFYMTFRNVVKIQEEKLILSSFLLIPYKPIEVSTIESITSHRNFRNISLDIKLIDGTNHSVPTQAFEFEQSLGIIYALKKINPHITLTDDLRRFAEVYEDKQQLKFALEEFKKTESGKALKIIAVAAASVFCIWLYKISTDQEYTLRQLADLFIGFVR
ncbi:hypothetical protein A3D71_01045 [Candidatus Kaiserbacteria bacterium RIFCSPHIGHO2_02_FULL_55_20]|uniref:Uncharacterized protein n=1 Tax=Candidatus Kaiserbacteria bacterium RIFCSPHIGHO2_02_FULL_55_20 TaxID=1798497 RepID=A0A1F6DW28_9BACT|nr:MAG: hypothetical protein A2680_02685 [Candidatus Kaiserbacteria bacterium RIFCSPHIGHO2_01_FULL_55_37]OGG65490.1 MAG: hypothetical protein A3D71_01045 [Candidatus Kaiserbacteria bacterium RIFCSPHIGHO2_02_FULL_55_20]